MSLLLVAWVIGHKVLRIKIQHKSIQNFSQSQIAFTHSVNLWGNKCKWLQEASVSPSFCFCCTVSTRAKLKVNLKNIRELHALKIIWKKCFGFQTSTINLLIFIEALKVYVFNIILNIMAFFQTYKGTWKMTIMNEWTAERCRACSCAWSEPLLIL